MKRLAIAATMLALAAPVAAQQAGVPDLLKQAFAPPAAVAKQLYAYDFSSVTTGTSPSSVKGHIDPSKPKGQRVTITEAIGEKMDLKKIDARYEENADGEIFCDQMSDPDVKNVVDKGSVEGVRTFTFNPKARPKADGEIRDIFKKLTATAVVEETTGALRTFSAVLPKATNMMLIATVKGFDMKVTCAPAPNGRAYPTRMDMRIDASALGKDIKQLNVQTYSNLVAVSRLP